MRPINPWPLFAKIEPSSPAGEAYRVLRTHIRFALGDGGGRTVCVVSCLPGEGRSLTAANLATALAREGRSTLLVDADLRKPVLHRIFQCDGYRGLTHALERPESWMQAAKKTGVAHLTLLAAGSRHPEPAELLSGGALGRILDEAREAFDAVVLDTPPLIPYADARIAAALSDGVLMVVGAGKVKRRQVTEALGHLRQVGANVLGAVVNG
jgi:capsular exopolysaccharide synthesis family protein